MAITVYEITMASPDVVRIEVRDGVVGKGEIEAAATGENGTQGSWQTRNDKRCLILGPDKTFYRYEDTPASDYLDRAAADVAAEWSVGALTPSAVYRRTEPYDSGQYGPANTVKAVSMRHFLYLKLPSDLTEGVHTIAFPDGVGLTPVDFTFDDRVTRACSIRSTQNGHRPGDTCKLAYLSLWMPGAPNEGAVQFSATEFHVINRHGAIVYTGAITLRTGPTDSEANSGTFGSVSNSVRCASATQDTWSVTDITQANPGVVTYSGDGDPSNVDVVRLDGIGGMTSLNDSERPVANVNTGAKTFEMSGTNTSALPAYTSGGTIYRTHVTNRSGTYVYGLDFSGWMPSALPGTYRIQIDGLGCSDPFAVDDSAWFRTYANSLKGFYHQRAGCALDGRFGYARPVNYRASVGKTITKSLLPYAFSRELLGNVTGSVSIADALNGTYGTVDTLDAWGGHMDAGDHDRRLVASNCLCGQIAMTFDVLNELSAPVVSAINVGVPKCSELLDASLYAGTDSLPDPWHECMWTIDLFRRLQEEGGLVRGGVESTSNHQNLEPFHLDRNSVFVYAPDHITTFAYACLAAKNAFYLASKSLTALAAVYEQSAIEAWNAAEIIYDTGDATARDALYATVKTAVGDSNYNTVIGSPSTGGSIQGYAAVYRLMAAGALYRLTGDHDKYGAIIVAAGTSNVANPVQSGLWDYARSDHAGANATAQANIDAAIVARAETNMVGYSEGDIAYRNLQFLGVNASFGGQGNNIADTAANVIRAHMVDGGDKYLEVLQAHLSWCEGANQLGLCQTSGMGVRAVNGTLHQDRIARGLDSPAGITVYGRSSQTPLMTLNFQAGALNYITENSTTTADYEEERNVDPYRFCVPPDEALYEVPTVIEQMEYTVQQTIVPKMYTGLYLHGHDGNAQSSLSPPRISLSLQAVAP